jgi:hypothetical protein
MADIPRIDNPKPQMFFEEFVRKGKPAVITGAMPWKILERDARTFFSHDKGVLATVDQEGLYGPGHYTRRLMQFGELLQAWESRGDGPFHYMDQQPIKNLHPELMESIGFPPFIDPSLLVTVNLWMGEGRIRWHYDGVDNFLAHIRGRKEVRLLAPENLPSMYVFGGQWSAIDDVDDVDLEDFPRGKKVGESLNTVLDKGEMVFIPAGWWHTAAAVGGWGASVNYWYDTWYGERRSNNQRPFDAALTTLTELLSADVPPGERAHYCRYATEMISRIAGGHTLPKASRIGWDNPDGADVTPLTERVPPKYPDR